ncbi:MAG: holin-associated N-acetylmuramidase [Rhodobacteraceae bacterium]|nr:holin-associated N-acetylmuramidase [Paracoccaceae bacterium]
MKTVNELAEEIIRREGGYVNDPDDPGGATNFGVTIGTMKRLGLDLDGDGQITPKDVRILSKERAANIFIKQYYERPRINLLPAPLQPSVMDMYVNAGGNAVKILQRLLREFDEPVTVDGALGPQSAGATKRAMAKAPDLFVDAYGIARRNYYYRLGDKRPSLRKFARRRDGGKGGWIKRAEEFISSRFHFSKAEHTARVRAWA